MILTFEIGIARRTTCQIELFCFQKQFQPSSIAFSNKLNTYTLKYIS